MNDIEFFIDGCREIGVKELDRVREIALTSIRYYRGSKVVREQVRELQELENKWYESLPWYDVYSADYYIADLWACWVVYSKGYLRSLLHEEALSEIVGRTAIYHSIYSELKGVKSICDLGCGIGMTTAYIKELFPEADVFGTNILGNQQSDFAMMMARKHDFEIIPSIDREVDLVFASEYFEHFYEPVEHLREVLSYNPSFLIIANSFNSVSIGHFPEYLVDGVLMDGRKTSRAFNNELRKHGYEKVRTGLWNSRPSYWRKD